MGTRGGLLALLLAGGCDPGGSEYPLSAAEFDGTFTADVTIRYSTQDGGEMSVDDRTVKFVVDQFGPAVSFAGFTALADPRGLTFGSDYLQGEYDVGGDLGVIVVRISTEGALTSDGGSFAYTGRYFKQGSDDPYYWVRYDLTFENLERVGD